jgi:hypothetical protein
VRKLSAALFFLIVAAAAGAEWKTVSTNSEPGTVAGLEHRHVVLESPANNSSAIVDLAIFSVKSCALRVIDNPNGGDNLTDAMQREKCVAGVNGGYFDPDFKPIGLRVVDGKLVAPLVRARLLTGIVTSSPRGVQIARIKEFSRGEKLEAAMECGPFLVDLATAVRGLDDTRLARRTFVAIDRGGRAALGVCSSVSLAQAGKILSMVPLAENSKIWRALNLDGGSSSAFWFKPKDGRAFSIQEQKTVRDFVGVVPK